MPSVIRKLIDCLPQQTVTYLGNEIGLSFHRKSPRKEQLCRSLGQRFGADGALDAAIGLLRRDGLITALSKKNYEIWDDDLEDVFEWRVVNLALLTIDELRTLAGDVFGAEDELDLNEAIDSWGDNFRLESGSEDDDEDDEEDDDEDEDEDDDNPPESRDSVAPWWDDEDLDDSEEAVEMSIERFVKLVREAPDRRVRGTTFYLDEVPTGDPQPLMPHQGRTIDKIARNNWHSGIVHLPTGSGKTRVAMELIRQTLEDDSARVIWASHGVSLIRQSMIRLAELMPMFRQAIRLRWLSNVEDATDPHLFDDNDVVFSTQDTLRKWLAAAAARPKNGGALREALTARAGSQAARRILLVYDECHELGAPELQRSWRKFHEELLTRRGGARFAAIGLSATPLPTDTNRHPLLQKIVFPVRPGTESARDWGVLVHNSESMRALTEANILCPINLRLQKTGAFEIKRKVMARACGAGLAGFRRPRAGAVGPQVLREFSIYFNRGVMTDRAVLQSMSDRIGEYLKTLGKTLVFCASITAANTLVDLLRRNPNVGDGRVTLVHSRMEDSEILDDDEYYDPDQGRKEAQIKAFVDRGSEPCVMVNVGMLTTGFDDPKIRTVVIARLTFSKNLFWQMIGRGLRGPYARGTSDCYVIDPIRLTAGYEVFQGYRPDVRRGGLPRHDIEADRGGYMEPDELVPVVRDVEVRPDAESLIDSRIRASVQKALRAFLTGDEYDIDEVVDALSEVKVESRPEGAVVLPSAGVPREGSMLAMLEAGIRGLENEMGADLGWLAGYIPPVLNENGRRVFLGMLGAVKKRGIRTLEEWLAFQAKIWEIT